MIAEIGTVAVARLFVLEVAVHRGRLEIVPGVARPFAVEDFNLG